METLASNLHYSYVATILFIVNIVFISLTRKDIINPLIAIGIIVSIILLVNMVVYNPINQIDWIWVATWPSYREFIINFLLAFFSLILLKKMQYKVIFIISLIIWCGFLIALSFLIRTYDFLFYYSITVDILGILVTIVFTIETIRTKKIIMCVTYHNFCPILSLFILIFWYPVKGTFSIFPRDMRANEIVCIQNSALWEDRNPQEVVCELHNTIDTEKRFIKIIDFIKNGNENVNYMFIEDTFAALNFYRTTYISNDDYIIPRDAYPKLTINYRNNRLKDNFEYPCDSTNFKIVSSYNNLIYIEGDFEDLTLKRFCAFQKFLSDGLSDLTNRKISLYNKNDIFKLGIQYFEHDEYQLYLDESFLNDN